MGYPDGFTQTMHDRIFDTGVDSNALQRELEQRAEDEIAEQASSFREWLLDDPDRLLDVAYAVMCWPHGGTFEENKVDRASNIYAAECRMRDAYVQWRVEDADLREEVIRSMRGEA